jgi:hypothetical protein
MLAGLAEQCGPIVTVSFGTCVLRQVPANIIGAKAGADDSHQAQRRGCLLQSAVNQPSAASKIFFITPLELFSRL